MSRGARKTLTGGQRAIQRGQAAAGVQQIGLLCDLTEQGVTLLTAGQTNKEKILPFLPFPIGVLHAFSACYVLSSHNENQLAETRRSITVNRKSMKFMSLQLEGCSSRKQGC